MRRAPRKPDPASERQRARAAGEAEHGWLSVNEDALRVCSGQPQLGEVELHQLCPREEHPDGRRRAHGRQVRTYVV